MVVSRELSLKVTRSMWGNSDHYWIDDEVTVHTNEDAVYVGKIVEIEKLYFSIQCDEDDIAINYTDIKNIVHTDWLAGEDIRNFNQYYTLQTKKKKEVNNYEKI